MPAILGLSNKIFHNLAIMHRSYPIFLPLLICLLLSSCTNNGSQIKEQLPVVNQVPEPSKEDILDKVDDEDRIVWQKPAEVVRLLGDISYKTIADIGAGSGYFTFRIALKAKKVIAIDIDPTMIKIVETFQHQLPEEIQNKIETRLALPNDPKIADGEVDMVVIINTIGYIEDRAQYLNVVKKGLTENGEIFILDFKTKNIPINAPPMEYRIPLGTLETDLINAGFEILTSDDRTLDYQYILKARKK